jgi:hypothetical protein
MNMQFTIQVSRPSLAIHSDISDAESLGDVIEAIFSHETEDAYLNWNGVRVPINYKYDLSVILEDAVPMLLDLVERLEGSHTVTLSSSTLSATWHLTWMNGVLSMSSDWSCVSGRIEDALLRVSNLELPVAAFLSEWSGLIRYLSTLLEPLGLRDELAGWLEFQRVAAAAALASPGALYRHDALASG